MGECAARTQGAPIAGLSGRLRTRPRAAQRGRATQSLIVVRALKPEQALDLVPAADDERHGEREQDRHHDVEAVPREPALLPGPHARLSAGPVAAVPDPDPRGFDLGAV